MPTLYTHRNYITIGRALPGDRYVATFLQAPDGRCLLTTQPIDQLPSAICWAMGMADFMAGPISILPITSEEDLLREIIACVAFETLHNDTTPQTQHDATMLLTKIGFLK